MSDRVQWRRTADCESSGCVEVAFTAEVVFVRSSDEPGKSLTLSRAEWQQLRTGDFGEAS